MIVSGGTIARTVNACHERGASAIYAAATHGLFAGGADEKLSEAQLQQLLITDTVPSFGVHSDNLRAKLEILNTAPLFAEAIKRIHCGGSIEDLLSA